MDWASCESGETERTERSLEAHLFQTDLRATEGETGPFAAFGDSAILIADPDDGRVIHLTPAAQKLWEDWSPTYAVDEDQRVHPADRTQIANHRVLAGRGEFQQFEYRIINREGGVSRCLRETSFPIPTPPGADRRIGGILEDVSPEVPVYLVQPFDRRDVSLVEPLALGAARIRTFASNDELLKVADVLNPGCIVIDLRHARIGRDGLLDLLRLRPAELQVILVGEASTPSSEVIAALKTGAADYVLEPEAAAALPGAVRRVGQQLVSARPSRNDAADSARDRVSSLPCREREVLLGLLDGGTNKSIARTLGISPRTVESHRAHLMQRLNCPSLAKLLHFARDAGLAQTA